MKTQCGQCPFKKDSLAGYLGEASYNPEEFLATIEHQPLPCHLTVNWEDDDQEKALFESEHCIGALKFLKNTMKMPRDAAYAKLRNSVEKDTTIFETRHELIAHHTENDI